MDRLDPLSVALRQCRLGLVMLCLFSLFVNLLLLTTPIYMMQIFDRVLTSGRTETLFFLTAIAGAALAIMGGLEVIRSRLMTRVGLWLDDVLSPHFITAGMQGTLAGIAVNAQPLRDVHTLKSFYSGSAIKAIVDSLWVPAFIAVLWIIHPWLGIAGIVFGLLLFGLAVINEFASRRPTREASAASIRNTQDVDLATRNADVMQAMGLLQPFIQRWGARNDAVLALQRIADDRNTLFVGISKFVRMFAQLAALGLGAYLVLGLELTPGGMIAGSILLARGLAPVEQSIGAWRGFLAARGALDRLAKVVHLVPAEDDKMPLPAPRGDIRCEGVTYLPPGQDKPALFGVSFAVEAGEAVGILGPSSAGKTTLCKLLVGTRRPNRGHVRLDGADLHNWDPAALGPHIGYLPQDVQLFSGTIRDNIARLQAEPDPEMVVRAAQLAGVHEMILRLPSGYDTEIGDGGAFLSGGQRQRIGLARALYGAPTLLVLDEPNSNLDTDGAAALVGAIELAKGWGATIFIVAHHAQILRPVDKILMLRDGQLEMFGPRDEVLKKLIPAKPQLPKSEPAPVTAELPHASVAADKAAADEAPAAQAPTPRQSPATADPSTATITAPASSNLPAADDAAPAANAPPKAETKARSGAEPPSSRPSGRGKSRVGQVFYRFAHTADADHSAEGPSPASSEGAAP